MYTIKLYIKLMKHNVSSQNRLFILNSWNPEIKTNPILGQKFKDGIQLLRTALFNVSPVPGGLDLSVSGTKPVGLTTSGSANGSGLVEIINPEKMVGVV